MPKIYVAPSAQSENTVTCQPNAYPNEKQQAVALANKVVSYLRQYGFTVYYDPNYSLSDKIKRANSVGVNFYLSLHTNAAGTTGCKTGEACPILIIFII